MGAGGVPHAQLRFLRESYALSLHGVGLSIGSPAPLDRDHLSRLRPALRSLPTRKLFRTSRLVVAWRRLLQRSAPLPYTEATLDAVISHVDETQNALARKILIENPATYVRFAQSEIAETDFLAELARATGCGLLLDVNNVYRQRAQSRL